MLEHLHDPARRPRETPFRRSGSQTLSKTVAQGISVGSWKTKPILPAPFGHSTIPFDAVLNPAMMRSAVDLPQPDGPSRLTKSPSDSSDMSRPSGRRAFERGDAVGERLADLAQAAASGALSATTECASGRDPSFQHQGSMRCRAYFFRSRPTPLLTKSSV